MANRRLSSGHSDQISIGRRTYGVKVNHLPQDTRKEEVLTFFQQYGSISNVSVKTGSTECYAFVNFNSNSCAQEAAKQTNATDFRGKRINCKVQGGTMSERRSPSIGEYTVKVTFLSKTTTEATLSNIFCFENSNSVQSVRVVPCSLGSSNYAYVNYFHMSDADRAVVDLDRRQIDGSEVRVKLHQPSSSSSDSQLHRAASYHGNHSSAIVPQPGSHSGVLALQPGSHSGVLALQPGSHSGVLVPQPGSHSGVLVPQPGSHSGVLVPQPGSHSGVLALQPGSHSGVLAPQPGSHSGVLVPQPGSHSGVFVPQPGSHSGVLPPQPGSHSGVLVPQPGSYSGVFVPQPGSHSGVLPPQPGSHSGVLALQPGSHSGVLPPQPGNHSSVLAPQPDNHSGVLAPQPSSPLLGNQRCVPRTVSPKSSHTSQPFPHSGSPRHTSVATGSVPLRQSSAPAHMSRFSPSPAGSRVLRAPSYPGANPQTGSGHQIQRHSSHPVVGFPLAGTTASQSCTVKVSIFGTLRSEDIEEVFSKFGALRAKPIVREGDPHYVFVNFSTPKAAADACSLHNSTVRQVRIHVKTHAAQKPAGIQVEPMEVKCTPLLASILSTKYREELERLGNLHQVMVKPSQNCIKVWGPREQLVAVELCLQSLLKRVQGAVTVKDCELPGHSVPLFEQDSAIDKVRKIETNHGVEFQVIRAPPDSTPVDLASFCRDVKQCFVPTQSGSSTAIPTCSELAFYLTEKQPSPPTPTEKAKTTWLWQNDSGSGYLSYAPDVSSELSRAFADSPSGSVTLKIGSYQYRIDFLTMTQTNTTSSHSRPIQRATGGGQVARWFYVDDRREFAPYTAEQSEKIEKMYMSNAEGPVVINHKHYGFDFTSMRQYNVLTRKARTIERRVAIDNETEDPVPNVEQVLTLQAAGLPESVDPSLEELRGVVERATIQKECQLNRESSKSFKAELMKNMNQYFVTAELVDECLRLKGTPRYVERVHLIAEQEKLSNREQMMEEMGGAEFRPPAHWRPQREEVILDTVKPNSVEWCKEVLNIKKTLRGATIVRLERIQNKWLWERYLFAKKRMIKTNKGHVNEKHLFHGTRHTPPEKVFKSEKGVDFRFSREGLWGTGSYFAVNASYSDAYAYSTPGSIGEKQMFICKVLTGDSYNAETNTDRLLRQPPLKQVQSPGSFEERYDSVKGYTNGSHVYVVYDHEKVYPEYLVTYYRH